MVIRDKKVQTAQRRMRILHAKKTYTNMKKNNFFFLNSSMGIVEKYGENRNI